MYPYGEDWLTQQLTQYDSAFKDVLLGDTWIKEFVMQSFDVPLSKNFASFCIKIVKERYKKVLMAHQGFTDLKEDDQVSF